MKDVKSNIFCAIEDFDRACARLNLEMTGEHAMIRFQSALQEFCELYRRRPNIPVPYVERHLLHVDAPRGND